jgi:hypothetical protein
MFVKEAMCALSRTENPEVTEAKIVHVGKAQFLSPPSLLPGHRDTKL